MTVFFQWVGLNVEHICLLELAMGRFSDFGWQQRYARFCWRIVVLSILSLLLYPFLWAWTVTGTQWFKSSKDCGNIAIMDELIQNQISSKRVRYDSIEGVTKIEDACKDEALDFSSISRCWIIFG